MPFPDTNSEVTSAAKEGNVGSDENSTIELTDSEREFLSNYINETYLTQKSIDEIRDRFEEDSSVQLRHFIKDDLAKKIQDAALCQDREDKLGKTSICPTLQYDIGVSPDWKAVGPAHKQRFLEYVGTSGLDSAGGLLKHLKCNVFCSPSFRRYLKCLTSLDEATGYRGRIRRFRPGLDYTVAHYGILTTSPVLDATLCFAAGEGTQCKYDEETGEVLGSDEDEDVMWESGDYGGFSCYIEQEAENLDAAEEYNEEDDTELLSVAISNNTLSLVFRDPGTLRFVKYVGSRAPSSRWDLSLEYEIPEEGESIVDSTSINGENKNESF